MKNEIIINIHAVIPASRVNGPGSRMVVYFQGCSRRCALCFNPETHPFEQRCLFTVEEIFATNSVDGIEGITVSGGEPFAQPGALAALLKEARLTHGLTTVVYTGFTLEEVRSSRELRSSLPFIDVLIDGPYDETRPEETLLARGSTNQGFHFLTNRYRLEDFYLPGKAEILIGPGGVVRGTGFSTLPFPMK